ncbi:MAG: ISL3 family transposase, partial [Planctomycetota bacterium]
VQCPKHGVKQLSVPWSEPGSRFTMLFEAWTIDWLQEASILAVSRLLDWNWDQVDGIQHRAVARGQAREKRRPVRRIGVDETAFQKRHKYVTVVTDQENSRVLYVGDGRKKSTLDRFYEGLGADRQKSIETVVMDMWDPYIQSTLEHVPNAPEKICYDKFHVAKRLGEAVDQIRRQEHRALMKEGDDILKGTKHHWLQNPRNMTMRRRLELGDLRSANLQTGRGWNLKATAMDLWPYSIRGWAKKAWRWWIGWAMRSRLEPMKKVARRVRDHLDGILNSIIHRVTNASSESINSKIQNPEAPFFLRRSSSPRVPRHRGDPSGARAAPDQWRKWRMPVWTMATPCWSATAVTSASRRLPPG